jgi:hypothetical protein
MAKIPRQNSKQAIQVEVFEALNSLSGPSELPSILELCNAAEARLLNTLVEIAKRQLRAKARRKQSSEAANDVVVVDSDTYQITVHNAPATSGEPPDSIHLHVLPIRDATSPNPFKEATASAPVGGLGRYRSVSVSMPERFAEDAETLAEASSFALQTGYSWLTEKVSSLLSEIRNDAVDALYSHIRTVLPKHAHLICLHLFRENRGVYVHDVLVARMWMQRAGERKTRSTHSPIELVSQFATEMVEFKESFSRFIHADKTVRNFRFVRAGYSHSGLQIAEMAVYQSDKLVCHPLVTEDQVLLSAGYPVEIRSEIEETLTQQKPRLRHILLNAQSELRRMHQKVEALRMIGKPGSRAVEALGTFVGAGFAAYERAKGE